MTGALLQLVANSGAPQNIWLDHDPQITFFKKVFRRTTPFATEMVKLLFNSKVDFASSASIDILPIGDLMNRLFLVFDIPKLAAIFPNSKTQDIQRVINESSILDKNLISKLKSFVSVNDGIELDNLFRIIDVTHDQYVKDQNMTLNMIEVLENYFDDIDKDQIFHLPRFPTTLLDSDKLSYNTEKNNVKNHFQLFKNHLADQMINQKKEYVLIHELIKLIYYSEKEIADLTPMMTQHNIEKSIQTEIFHELFPNKEIQKIYHGEKSICNFGSDFCHILNTYNAIIGVLQMLGKSIPIVIIKPYLINDSDYDIYSQSQTESITLMESYQTIIDPNYRMDYMINLDPTISNHSHLLKTPLMESNNLFYPTKTPNSYLEMYHEQVSIMFDNIRRKMDQLFDKYQNQIFNQTENLFFNCSTPYSNIYSYVIPQERYQDNENHRIKNVFNANIWFFYFFKYLDSFDESDFGFKQKSFLSENNLSVLENMIRLLKINLEYYMYEISYLLNDLYASCPSKIPNDSMKNYVPISHQLDPKLLAVTFIFHRNLVPTIKEMFQYIHHFISSITVEQIEESLDVRISKISDEEMLQIREMGHLIYHYINNHFIGVYNSFHFELPIIDTVHSENPVIQDYVEKFLNELVTLPQMEFYYIAEMVHMKEQQNLYKNVLFNQDFVKEKAGDLAGDLVGYINEKFRNTDDLYYETKNVLRFNGESYINTPYQSRFFGKVPQTENNLPLDMPIPLPPNNPYGVNHKFFNNHHLGQLLSIPNSSSEIPIGMISNRFHVKNHYLSQTYYESTADSDIDYFRIKHKLLQPKKKIDGFSVSDDQLNLLRLHKLTQQLIDHYPTYDMELLKWIAISISYAINFNQEESFTILMEKYLSDVNESLAHSKLKIKISFLNEVNVLISELANQKTYTTSQLIANNQSVQNHHSDTVTEKIIFMRNNFLSQYYYYVVHQDSIYKLKLFWHSLQQKNNDFGIGEFVNQLVKYTSDGKNITAVFEQMPSVFYIYPEMFPTEIERLHQSINQMDDFMSYIIRSMLTFLSPNKSTISYPSKLMIHDYLNIINTTFESVRMIYYLLEKETLTENFLDRMSSYQTMLLDHLAIINNIKSYIDSLEYQHLNHNNITIIVEMAKKYGIDNTELEQYLKLHFVPFYNSAVTKYQKISAINLIYHKIEHLIIQSKTRLIPTSNITIKKLIIKMIRSHFPKLEHYFKYINDEYYSFIYFFVKYAFNNQLGTSDIKNPIFSINDKIMQDWNNIDLYYHSFSFVSNLLQYLIDYLWDCSMMICNSSYYDCDRISQVFHQKNNHSELSTNRPIVDESIINILSVMQSNPEMSEIIEKALVKNQTGINGKYLKELSQHHYLIDFIKECMQKNMVIVHGQIQELKVIKQKICDIIYRNKRAKMAWIRKLAHFFVKDATFMCGDQVANYHISDWFESYHEISKNDGTETGYLKMIGNREDLIIFNDKVKDRYTIVMPLVFYFNNHMMLSVPLNASINTKYQIKMKFRSIDDLTYKEEFSEFINPDTGQFPYTPHIQLPHLMVEYIYLSTEERRVFASNRLEYLFKEMQYDTNEIGDKNTMPIYQLGTKEKTKTMIKNGKKIKEKYYDRKQTVYINKTELNESKCYHSLIPRNDGMLVNYTDQTGCTKLMMMHNPLEIDRMIHYKQYIVDNKFYHPTEFMIILIKPLIHTDLSYRKIDSNYFYGEKQWDNYGLYSYHDLSKIQLAKKQYYQSIQQKINDMEDLQFGYINLINQMLIDYDTHLHISNHLDRTDKWIEQNLSLFLESIHLIKDAYLNYDGEIVYGENIIKLKEDLLSCNINFRITNYQVLEHLLDEILQKIGYQISSQLIKKYFYGCELTSSRFLEKIHEFIKDNIPDKINLDYLNQIISNVYNKYNEAVINYLISDINHSFAINEIPYHFFNLLSYFYNIYMTTSFASDDIINAMIDIKKQLDGRNLNITNHVKFMTFKDITQQIIFHGDSEIVDFYQHLIPHYIINMITEKMQKKLTQLFNEQQVELIDYQKYMFNNPRVNPLISGYLKFNGINIMPENSVSIMWSEGQSYQYFNHTPSTGINLHSWSLKPLSVQPQGSANLSRIAKFESVLNVHPLISDQYPASVVTMVSNLNIMRYLSGMCGKAWETQT